MKMLLILATLLASQMTSAQTIREEKIRKEMIERTELLIDKVEVARDHLDKKDVIDACKKIDEMFKIYPDHLKSIGSHLDFDRNCSHKAKSDALYQLIFMHKQTLICQQGKDGEYVDIGKLDKDLRKIRRSLKKQRRIIKRVDTDNENSFYYEYEF